MRFLAGLIWLVHMLLIAFMVLVPFCGNLFLLILHVIITPFILLHWATNNDVCCLTELEYYFRGGCRDKTFFGQLIHPVYRLHQHDEKFVIRIATIVLLIIAISRLYRKRDELWEMWCVWKDMFRLMWRRTTKNKDEENRVESK